MSLVHFGISWYRLSSAFSNKRDCYSIVVSECIELYESTYISHKNYRKFPKLSDTQKFVVITLKVKQDGFSLE